MNCLCEEKGYYSNLLEKLGRMGRPVQYLENVSGLLSLPGGMADSQTAEEGHQLEEGLVSWFEIGLDSLLLATGML